MKFRLSALFVAMFAFCFATISTAQDDLYYNPADDNAEVTYNNYEVEDLELAETEDVDDYEYLDDYDYHYSSRIRRFARPTSFGYYDPFFTDRAYYNGLVTPGLSIYTGNPYSYSSYRRAIRNSVLFGNPYSIGFNSPYGRTSAYSPFINQAGFGGFGFNNAYGRSSSFGGYNAFCPPTSYGTSRSVRATRGSSNATYGPRGTSTSRNRSYDSSVRRGTSRNTESVRGSGSSTRSRTNSARSNTTRRTYNRGNNNSSSRRSYSTPRRSSSSRSYSTPKRSSSRSYSTPSRSSSRSYSTPRSSSRRN